MPIISDLASLLAAIDGKPLYTTESYTYTKQCKKAIIGFENDLVQILPLPYLYGGIRDLEVSLSIDSGRRSDLEVDISGHLPIDITSYIGSGLPSDILAYLYAIKFNAYSNIGSIIGVSTPVDILFSIGTTLPKDIFSFIGAANPVDIQASIKSINNYYSTMVAMVRIFSTSSLDIYNSINGVRQRDVYDLPAYIGGNTPIDILSSITSSLRNGQAIISLYGNSFYPENITSVIEAHPFLNIETSIGVHIYDDLPIIVAAHSPSILYASAQGYVQFDISYSGYSFLPDPYDVSAYIRAFQYKDLPFTIHGWLEQYISAFIDIHLFTNLSSYLKVFQKNSDYIAASTHGWAVSDIGFDVLRTMYSYNLAGTINVASPVDLLCYINIWNQSDIGGSIHTWGILDLYGSAYCIYSSPLSIDLIGHSPESIRACIKSTATNYSDLFFYIRALRDYSIGGSIHGYIHSSILSSVVSIPYVSIQGYIHGFDEIFINGSIYGVAYPYDITASIIASGGILNIGASIYSKQAVGIFSSLQSTIEAYALMDIRAAINTISACDISAELIVRLGCSSLYASIVPDMVRMTKIITVSTMQSLNISAMINVMCSGSNLSEIAAYIKCMYTSSIGFQIIGKEYVKEYKDLCATIGYDDSRIVVDKLPIYVHTFGDYYLTTDKLVLNIMLMRGGAVNLSASIVGSYFENSISASIKGMYVEDYAFKNSSNRALFYEVNKFDYSAPLSKIVEFTFKNMINEYTYFPDSETAFPSDVEGEWVAKLAAYLPENKITGLKRRLHKFKNISVINKYRILDNLINDTILYLTEDATYSLSASINMERQSTYNDLFANIGVRSTSSTYNSISAAVVPVSPTLIVGLADSII